MPPILLLVNAALEFLKLAMPKIAEMTRSGEISIADQEKVLNDWRDLKENLDERFSGPEWKIE